VDISQILKSSTTGTNTSTQTAEQKAAQAAAKLSPASQAINKAGNRIQSQLDTTSAQLSAYGKLKSAVSDAQLAAKSLSGLTAASSATDVKTAVSKLISTFNTAITTGKTTAGIADSGNARRVGNDLGRAISSNHAVFDAMKKIGFKQMSDGTLSLDTAKLEAAQKANPAAVEATLEKLGSLVNKVASKELATDSAVAGSIEALSQRASLLKTQKNAMTTLMEQLATQSSKTSPRFGGYGVSAYQSNS
jgi:flagellar capping protein FliD